MKSIMALIIGFWNVCKQLPGFFIERLEAYADEMERENEAMALGVTVYELNNIKIKMEKTAFEDLPDYLKDNSEWEVNGDGKA